MAAVSLFRDTDMTAVTSRENILLQSLCLIDKQFLILMFQYVSQVFHKRNQLKLSLSSTTNSISFVLETSQCHLVVMDFDHRS